jgi:alkylation response protein AidB-like acyl-CoA dehydrogenase
MSRERAKRVTLSYLADVFPRHFSQPAPKARGSDGHRARRQRHANGSPRAFRFATEEADPARGRGRAERRAVSHPTVEKRHKKLAVELGFSAMDVPKERGRGSRFRIVDQVAVWELLGRVTNALCWCFSEAQDWMFAACTEEQIQRYILPLMSGERKECYAITESGSGSDVAVETLARRAKGGYAISGEKWYVTSANTPTTSSCRLGWPRARTPARTRSSSSTRATPGIEVLKVAALQPHVRRAPPDLPLQGRLRARANRLGPEVMACASRMPGSGASGYDRGALLRRVRAAHRGSDGLREAREVGGEPLAEKQMVQAMLADSVTELWAARLITFEAAEAHDRGDDLKSLHARCSIAKLYASEAANRIADRALQILGGRGYMRENAAERFYRELRVDRIWEGASEVQRLIIARALVKRGLGGI